MHAPTVYRLNFELSISFHKALLSILIRIIWPGNLILSLITNFYSFSAKRQLKCKKKFPFILLAHLTMPHVPSYLFLFSGRIASCTLRNPDNDLLLLIRAADETSCLRAYRGLACGSKARSLRAAQLVTQIHATVS